MPRSPREQLRSPFPADRIAAGRPALLDLADAVEAAAHADPAVLVEIEALLCDGARSPLLNTDIPFPELAADLRRARYRLPPTPEPSPTGGAAATDPARPAAPSLPTPPMRAQPPGASSLRR